MNKIQKISTSAFISNEDKVLLLKRSKNEDPVPEHWELPGGTLEFGEELINSLGREIKEETNLKVEIIEAYSAFSSIYGEKQYIDIQYFCKFLGGEIKISEEHDEYVWAKEEDLTKLKISKEMRQAILDGFKLIKKD